MCTYMYVCTRTVEVGMQEGFTPSAFDMCKVGVGSP